jgi:uncharacterized protein (TIGR03790 family)
MRPARWVQAAAMLTGLCPLAAQTADQVLVVVNRQSRVSGEIGAYYMQKRAVPAANLCALDVAPNEIVTRAEYETRIEAPVSAFLKRHNLTEKILYIVLTSGVPLRIGATEDGGGNRPFSSNAASVDSELTLLYRRMRGEQIPLAGPVPNPFFRQRDAPFRHPLFPIYMVTRLDAYTMADMKALVDRALIARNTGKFVIDLRADNKTPGNQWLRDAALLLPRDRVVMDDTAKVLTNLRDVIGYASWGSNDRDHTQRFLHFQWLPGAITTEFVSTDARTLHPPPDSWEIGVWAESRSWYAGGPQSLTGDYIREGASGASGQVDEPYLSYCPRPDYVLPAYYSGRNLAESFYMGIPGLSWMNIVIGDPLMRLR